MKDCGNRKYANKLLARQRCKGQKRSISRYFTRYEGGILYDVNSLQEMGRKTTNEICEIGNIEI